jgi:hypothetical protein
VKTALLAVCAVLWAAPCVFAQKLELKFDALAARASDKVEMDLDSSLLPLFLQMSGEKDHDGLLNNVRAIRVRTYSFAKAGEYSQKDLEPLRSQVSAQSRWSRVINHKEGEQTTEIWVAADGGKLGACLIVAAEDKELSVVYLEGTMSLGQVKGLMEHDGWHGLVRLAQR